MPRFANLSNLKLHSPSSIIGTPFSNDNNTRFEYPFPNVPASEAMQTPLSLPSSATLIAPKLHSHSPVAHPKLKMTPNPPVPPTLVAKKAARNGNSNSNSSGDKDSKSHMRKWSLGAMGQRRSSSGQSSASASTSGSGSLSPASVGSPPLSPGLRFRR